MQFLELKQRGWWATDDDPTTPSEITNTEMGILINQAVADMSKVLNIVKTATITLTSNVGVLPTDFLEPIKAETATGTLITQIDSIKYKDRSAPCWFISNSTTFTVYPIATNVSAIALYYMAYADALVNDTDVPTSVPTELQHYISDVWVKAHYALKNNLLDEYNGLMQIWDDVLAQVAQATGVRRVAASTRRTKKAVQ